METFSGLLALCEGNPPVTGGFHSQRPVTWTFVVFFDLQLGKQWRRRWFQTPSRSLWRHFNVSNEIPWRQRSGSTLTHVMPCCRTGITWTKVKSRILASTPVQFHRKRTIHADKKSHLKTIFQNFICICQWGQWIKSALFHWISFDEFVVSNWHFEIWFRNARYRKFYLYTIWNELRKILKHAFIA